MKPADYVAGVRHVWALDKPGVLAIIGYVVVYAGSVVIVGAPIGWALGVTALGLLTIGYKIYDRAKDHREAIEFHAWMVENTDTSGWPASAE